MENAPDSDVEDYLYQVAEKNPDMVLELYTSGDIALKLLLIDAKKNGIILKKDGMYNYAVKVYKNILRVSTGNSFKIGNELAFKDKDKGYPVELFLELFKQVVINKQEFDSYVDHKMIEYTSIALKDMRIRGANKPLIFDIWVLNIRTLR